MQQKLERNEYSSLKEFVTDITQIFENARMFYPKKSDIYRCADVLEKQFRAFMLEIKSEMKTRTSGGRRVCIFIY